jgi:hypothetical protein
MRATLRRIAVASLLLLIVGQLFMSTAVYAIAAIQLSPNSGRPGMAVAIYGADFVTGETINVTFDGTPVCTAGPVDVSKNWSSSFPVPSMASGSHNIIATGSSGGSASSTFNIVPGFTMGKTSGAAGTSVTVNGSGFAANEASVTVTFDGNPVGTPTTANAAGSWTATFPVPSAPAGAHSVSVYGASSTGLPVLSFTIAPTLTANKSTAPPGTSVTINGSGFSSGETGVTVTYDGQPIGFPVVANATGAWTANFVVPASAAGVHIISAYGTSTMATSVPNINFSIGSGITINKTSGPPGSSVTITGSGFAANETGITITYDSQVVAQAPAANATGAWTATFAIPASGSGSHTLGAFGSSTAANQVPTATFSIQSGISVSKASGSSGTSVTVSGYGFGTGETGIQVLYDEQVVAQNISANANGAWTATFTAPTSSAGAHTISAKGSVTQQVGGGDTSFKVSSGLSINPATAHIGDSITISGSGFAPTSGIKFTYDDNDVTTEKAVTTDASGSFKGTVVVPKSKAGSHTFKASDAQNNAATVAFTVDSTPPPIPNPLSPDDGSKVGLLGDETPTLRWSNVNDPSGVTYTIQMDHNSDFSAPILQKADINATHYTLSKSEALPYGEYFWRVRAVNGASISSAWSTSFMLQSGVMSATTLILLIVLGLAVVGGLAYLIIVRVGRKRQKAVIPIPVPEQPPEIITPEIVRPEVTAGQWRTIGPGTGVAPDGSARKALPFRLALPQAEKKANRGLSSEDQARIKVIIDFAQSMPLIEPGYDLTWLAGLAESNTGAEASPALYEQLVRNEIQLRYEPTWMRHPTFQDLTTLLEGQPVLQDLNSFLDAVNRCASVTTQLLGDIFKDMGPDVPEDFFNKGGWGYISAVYTDAVSWFLGKYLKEPADRDYSIKSDGNVSGDVTTFALSGESNTPFAGTLVQGISEEDAQKLKALHLKLRRNYRNSDKARDVVSLISQLDVQRGRLLNSFSQFGQLNQ